MSATAVRFPSDKHLTYAELLEYIRLECPDTGPFVILAESFSTPLAVRWAALNPSGLKGLILCAGFVASPIVGWRARASSWLAPLVFRLRVPRFALRRWLIGSEASDGLAQTVQGTIRSLHPVVLVGRLRAVLSCDVRSELRKVEVPIHYIRAEMDRLIPHSSAEEIQRIRPDVTLSDVLGPHLILQEAPVGCARLVSGIVSRGV
jgi:pimeloyl-ACP methyl ester carboxylesterase